MAYTHSNVISLDVVSCNNAEGLDVVAHVAEISSVD